MNHTIIRFIFVVVALLSLAGQAFAGSPGLSNPRVQPNPGTAGQAISLIVAWDGCGSFAQPVIQRNGNIVNVRQTYSPICGVPPPSADLAFPLGTFGAGAYTLVYVTRSEFAATDDPPVSVPFGIGEPVSVPAASTLALALLAMLMLVAGRLVGGRSTR